jgi:hypothetical protein
MLGEWTLPHCVVAGIWIVLPIVGAAVEDASPTSVFLNEFPTTLRAFNPGSDDDLSAVPALGEVAASDELTEPAVFI